VTIRLDFSLDPRAPKAAHCTTQSLPLLTMDFTLVDFQPRDLFDGNRFERFGADDLWDHLHSPPQLSDWYPWQPDITQDTTPKQWCSAAAGKPCDDVDFATDVDLIDYADEAVPLFERVYWLPPLYPDAHVVEQAEPSPVVAAASPSDTSAAEQVRSCASSVVCLPKPLCTCSWEWLPRELPEVTPDGEHAQHHIDDNEDEATTSTVSHRTRVRGNGCLTTCQKSHRMANMRSPA
jgi:hypothetical protein